MKILHLISSGGMYGAEAVILNLAGALPALGHSAVLGVFENAGQPNVALHEAAIAANIESGLIPCQGQFDRRVPERIRALVRSTDANLIHAHGYKADVYTYLALRGSRVPKVSTCHTWYDNDLAVRLYAMIDRWVLRKFDAVVAVSEEVEQQLLHAGIKTARTRIIRNGIDVRRFASITRTFPNGAKQPARVGLVGRMAPEKGIDLFLEASAAVLRELPLTRFEVVGEGPDRPILEARLKELGLEGKVSLPGHCGDMPAFFASLDLLVSSSRREGLPIALLEGMASGLPLVATAVGAVPSIVDQATTGMLVPPEDVGALAAAMTHLLGDPGLRARVGEAARVAIAERFSAARMAADYLKLYEEVLASPSAANVRSQAATG